MNKISIILCDDHPLVVDGLRQLFAKQKDLDVVAECFSASELINTLSIKKADILLLDLHLKDGDGLELVKVAKRDHDIKVIGFSGVEDPAVISAFIRNGGNGYLVKSSPGEEIINAVRAVASGKEYLGAEVSTLLLKHIQSPRQKSSTDYIPRLSLREKEVLKLIVEEHTTQEIADKLFISVNTVETHRNHLLQKLGAKNLAGLVRIAMEKGLV